MISGARVTVDTDALVSNADKLSALLGELFFVVKSDAYGHGLERCVRTLSLSGRHRFAVYSLSEALAVRKNDALSEILILGRTPIKYTDLLVENGFIQTVFSKEYLDSIRSEANGLRVHIKINTGMNRCGFPCDADEVKNSFSGFRGSVEGVYTHFHGADCEDLATTLSELGAFERVADLLDGFFGKRLLHHAAASAAALRIPSARLDASRIGLALYGIAPDFCDGAFLRPVMAFTAPVVAVNRVKKGENIGYGCDHTAKNDMMIATISAGYGNGLPRLLEGRLRPSIDGAEAPFAARICMDRCMLDVTPHFCNGNAVKIGDEVCFFGSGRKIKEFSDAEGTVPYEVLTRVGAMNKRVYEKGG